MLQAEQEEQGQRGLSAQLACCEQPGQHHSSSGSLQPVPNLLPITANLLAARTGGASLCAAAPLPPLRSELEAHRRSKGRCSQPAHCESSAWQEPFTIKPCSRFRLVRHRRH